MTARRSTKRKADQSSLLQMSCFRRADPAEENIVEPSKSSSPSGSQEISNIDMILKNRKLWQDSWLRDWEWLEFNHDKGRVFCKFCKMDSKSKSTFGKEGSTNVRTSAFFEHASSSGHRHSSWLAAKGMNSMDEVVQKKRVSASFALVNLFKCAYLIAKEDLAFRKFAKLVVLMRECGAKNLTGHYENEKACAKFVNSISKSIEASIWERIKKSPFFGIMVDESTDISTTKHLIMFATFLEGPQVVTAFLAISKVVDGTAASIYEAIMQKVEECGLDTLKFVAFGSDGASVMTGCNTGVATRLKKYVNPFMISLHCVAHRTNLCLETASSVADCDAMCTLIDALVNKVASFFSRSTSRLNLLAEMEKELEYDELKMQGIQQTRWLSRHRAIKKLCDILEPILEVLKEENVVLYDNLRDFKVVYVLHYLADILQKLTDLSLDFQRNFVDVTTIGSLCNSVVMEIEAEFLRVRPIDLNGFDYDSKGYPIIPDFGSKDGLLFALRGAVKGNMYRGVEMRRSILGEDLAAAMAFQDAFSRAIIASLKDRMQEQELLSCLKVLAPVNMPKRARELQNFGSTEIHKLADFFGRKKTAHGKEYHAFIDKDQFLKEFPKFRMQASTDWAGKSFADTWIMISCMETWALKYPELLKVAKIGLVQCCSTATCERGFSRVNIIKVKYRNKLKSPAVEALVRIAIEGSSLEKFDFSTSIKHWESAAKFRHIYTGTPREIEGSETVVIDEDLEFPADVEEEQLWSGLLALMDQAAPLLSPDGDVECALTNSIALDPEQLPDQQPKIVLSSKERLVSLDIFRGLSIAMMILVDNAGGLWPSINHSPWDGVTIADLVMPFFLFIVGMAIPLAYKRITNKRVATEKAVIRSIKLFILGIVLQGGYFHGVNHLDYGIDVNRLRLCGILQRIAFAYVLVSICEIWLPKGPIVSEGGQFAIVKSCTAHWTVASLLAAFYLVMLYGIYVPDWQFQKPLISPAPLTVKCGVRGDLGPDCNAVGYIDRLLLGINHLYQKPMYQRTKACSINSPDYGPSPSDAPLWCQAPFDPEGILSSVSAVVTCFIGLHYGRVLVFMKGHKARLFHWIIPSLVLLVTGILLHCLGMHMNKPLYTFSYMCFTAGAAGFVFSGFYILADIYYWRFPTYLLEWMGTNSLLIFVLVACELLVLIVQGFYWNVPENNLVSFVKEDIFNYLIPSKRWALLAYVLFEIVFWCLIAGALKVYGLIWKF